MASDRLYSFVHWIARILAVLVTGIFLFFLIGEGVGPQGSWSLNPSHLSNNEKLMLGTLLGALLAMLLGWSWERWAGLATLAFGAGFFVELFLNHIVAPNPVGMLLFALIPAVGLLYLCSAYLRDRATD
jgi:hypothetical protein